MKRKMFSLIALIAIVTTALVACTVKSSTKGESIVISQDSLVKRGNYIVSTGGCDDCHSPKKFGPQGPEIDQELRLSGYPSSRPLTKVNKEALQEGWMLFNGDLTSGVGPWGVSFAANITSHETGIGNWSEKQFFTAMRHGKYKGMMEGRNLLPPMPWQNVAKLTDEDLKAIFAFLKTTKPVDNVVPSPIPPTEIK